jgi:hypothetical protein
VELPLVMVPALGGCPAVQESRTPPAEPLAPKLAMTERRTDWACELICRNSSRAATPVIIFFIGNDFVNKIEQLENQSVAGSSLIDEVASHYHFIVS